MTPTLYAPASMGGPSLEVMELGHHLLSVLDRRPAAIDLGAGSGRNSLFLSSLGFKVLAVEYDAVLAGQCEALLIQTGLDVQVVQASVATFVPTQKFDLCLCLGILHFLASEEAETLVRRLKNETSSHGFHILTIADPRYNCGLHNTLAEQGFLGSISADKILGWYKDWRLLAYERYTKTDDHLESHLDEHVIEKFIFTPAASNSRPDVFPRVWKLQQEKTPKLEGLELRQFVHSRASWQQLRAQLGPPDFDIVSSSPHSQLSAAPRSTGRFSLRVAFWGTLKLYFENGALVGFSRYHTHSAHSFAQANWLP